jgi:hypothetical protein
MNEKVRYELVVVGPSKRISNGGELLYGGK